MSSRTWILVAGVLALGACQEATAPDAALPSADVQFLAQALDATGAGLLDEMFLSGGPAAGAAAVGGPSSSTPTTARRSSSASSLRRTGRRGSGTGPESPTAAARPARCTVRIGCLGRRSKRAG